jgi:flavin reductase (DIM6/NTAB) family NADH-FMN oxidoreductase RutF
LSEHYERLRVLVSPVVAITTRRGQELNGLIVNSALRASLSPEKLRLSIIVHKFNHSHDMIFESGVFTAHVLEANQMDLVVRLGCVSGRDVDKMAALSYRPGTTGAPILDDCYAFYECRVVNAMDTGASTIFLGAAESAGGTGRGEVMTAKHVRTGIPSEYQERYDADLARAQAVATEMLDGMRALVWRGLATG